MQCTKGKLYTHIEQHPWGRGSALLVTNWSSTTFRLYLTGNTVTMVACWDTRPEQNLSGEYWPRVNLQ